MFKGAIAKIEEAEYEAKSGKSKLQEDIQALEDSLFDIREFVKTGDIQKAIAGIDELITSWQPKYIQQKTE